MPTSAVFLSTALLATAAVFQAPLNKQDSDHAPHEDVRLYQHDLAPTAWAFMASGNEAFRPAETQRWVF